MFPVGEFDEFVPVLISDLVALYGGMYVCSGITHDGLPIHMEDFAVKGGCCITGKGVFGGYGGNTGGSVLASWSAAIQAVASCLSAWTSAGIALEACCIHSSRASRTSIRST